MNLENIQITTECLKTEYNVGQTTWHNVCNGTISNVPWGAGDWALNIFTVAVTLACIGAVIRIIRD